MIKEGIFSNLVDFSDLSGNHKVEFFNDFSTGLLISSAKGDLVADLPSLQETAQARITDCFSKVGYRIDWADISVDTEDFSPAFRLMFSVFSIVSD